MRLVLAAAVPVDRDPACLVIDALDGPARRRFRHNTGVPADIRSLSERLPRSPRHHPAWPIGSISGGAGSLRLAGGTGALRGGVSGPTAA
jgi:hypothetical protein